MPHETMRPKVLGPNRVEISFGGGLSATYGLNDQGLAVNTSIDSLQMVRDSEPPEKRIGRRKLEKARLVAEQHLKGMQPSSVEGVGVELETAPVPEAHAHLFSTWIARNHPDQNIVIPERILIGFADDFLKTLDEQMYGPEELAKALRTYRSKKSQETRRVNASKRAEKVSAFTPESQKRLKKLIGEAERTQKERQEEIRRYRKQEQDRQQGLF